MLILTKSVFVTLISFLISIICAIILIPFLKKLKANQSINKYLEQRHKQKAGTPTMGGLIFIIPTISTIVILLLTKKIDFSYNLLIIIFTFISYAIIGFIDDYLIVVKKNNNGLSENKKLIYQIFVSLIFFFFFMYSGNEPLLWIHTINLKLDIGFLYGLFILFVLVATSNAVNITDGLDGLAGGLSAIAFFTFGIIAFFTGWLDGYIEIAYFCFSLLGSLLGFLIFNTSKAKVFMGDTGSLTLGATLGAIAIITRHEILLILIGSVFVIETLTCIIQRFYYKLTKRRIFPMTPIHHTFEKLGMDERDIVKIFWVIGVISSMVALLFGVWY
ncbi:MAG: phospho-N-acetylmuramoyl-pentapeptide-transferase [Mycoplasmatota bacterium]